MKASTVTVGYNPAAPTEVDIELTASAVCGS
jgi:hypothetical protein